MVVEVQIPFPVLVVEDISRELCSLLLVVVRLSGTSSERDWFVCGEVCAR